MTDQPTPRAPEQEAVVRDVLEEWLHRAHGVLSSHIHADWFIDWLGERGYGVAPEPSAPNDLREQIAEAVHGWLAPSPINEWALADVVMDVLRRNGMIKIGPDADL